MNDKGRMSRVLGIEVGGKSMLLLTCAFAMVMILTPVAVAQVSRESRQEVSRIAGGAGEPGGPDDPAAKLLELYNDKEFPFEGRLYALLTHIDHLRYYEATQKMEGALEKAIESYKLHRSTTFGKSPWGDAMLLRKYAQIHFYKLERGDMDSFDEILKIADEIGDEKYVKHRGGPRWRALFRAKAFLLTGQHEKAATNFETYLKQHPKPEVDIYTAIATCYQNDGRHDAVIKVLARGIEQYANTSKAKRLVNKMISSVRLQPPPDELVAEVISAIVLDGHAMQAFLIELTKIKFVGGDRDQALGCAKMCFELSPIESADVPVGWVTRCLQARDMDTSGVNLFFDFQKHGPAGPDGQVGTEDDLSSPLKDIPIPMPPPAIEKLNERLAQTLPDDGTKIYQCMRARGTIYLTMGKHKDALRAYRSAYAAAKISEVREGSGLVPCALKAMDGTVYRANQYLAFQRHGTEGEDGKRGTDDDIINPLGAEELPGFPPEVEKALRRLTKTRGNTRGACEARGFAFLALGEYKEGFDQMRAAYAFTALDERALATAIEDIAAAIKAYDGHVRRANQYLMYQRYGSVGEDGKAGTEDDITNPIPEILKEMKP